jgi:L-threonylcarbamoyladenylate synthase
MQLTEDIWNNKNLVKVLKEGGVAIMPTDTIYGMVGRAENESTVNRIYTIRKRNPDKPCIILIGDIAELEKFSINLSEEQKLAIKEYWPGPVSIVLDCFDEKLSYLHRGTNSLALRMPAKEALRRFLLEVGPLVAPSANTESFPPNNNVEDAKKYFGDSVDLYIDGGTLIGKASKIIKLHKDGSVDIIRQ